jgi:hypothetical protein
MLKELGKVLLEIIKILKIIKKTVATIIKNMIG